MPNKVHLPEAKTWIAAAIKIEEGKVPDQLWKNAPTAEDAKHNRLKAAKFLRKHGKRNSEALRVAERLEDCCRERRCLSGACPECGRLLQRVWVRESRKLISSLEVERTELVALSLVLPNSAVARGALRSFDLKNMQRRLKLRLDQAGISAAIGGIDFSFNEDEDGKYPGFWCPHVYLITPTADRRRLRRKLNGFECTTRIPRPKKITRFENTARRRSYAMKMQFERRIGYDDHRVRKEKVRECRNTWSDRLRAIQRFELLLFLDQIGFADRAIFRFVKPVIKDRVKWQGVHFDRITGSKRKKES
jgi:hypothetical protein